MRRSFAKLMAAIVDPEMRMRRLAEFLSTASPATVVITIEKSALSSGVSEQRVLYTSLVHLLISVRPRPILPGGPMALEETNLLPTEAHIQELIQVAVKLHARFAYVLLRRLWLPPDRYDRHMLPLHLSIEHIPLGVRRERARQPDRARWKPLLVDTTPAVVQILALNPRLREEDMVYVAAMRPHHPWALWAILLSFRWLSNDKVREAVALNSTSRPWIVLALAPLIGAKRLAHVLRRGRLPLDVMQAMSSLYDGACADLVQELVDGGTPNLSPLITYVDESEVESESGPELQSELEFEVGPSLERH